MPRYADLTGSRFGSLTVTGAAEPSAGKRRWLCRCDCGSETVVFAVNLKSGHTDSCGCKKSPDLTGKVFGRLTVVGRSAHRAPRGKRTVPLWECRCACGAVTYKAADVLHNPDESMCVSCAGKHGAEKARESAGFVGGTQITKIREMNLTAANTSGVRGVYLDKRTGKWRARLKFKGKTMNFGSYHSFEDAVNARRKAEAEYFGGFLETVGVESSEK
ncbi:MAG: hypothetical protein IJX76_08080 [Clostridia bacterium]|nr:hypothetical protein [Clostridia bacterium]